MARSRGEFFNPATSREELLARWERGWRAFFTAVDPLTDTDLSHEVSIRGKALSVHDAMHRSLGHTAYHVGQIVFLAKSFRGAEWKYLSIPPGESQAYNRTPFDLCPSPFAL